ncbi:MAG: hypothetical protein IJP05_05980 [Oscillospiraceae bacterium]|nr:hypothetical protein [Oscillospiraceae bacterium]
MNKIKRTGREPGSLLFGGYYPPGFRLDRVDNPSVSFAASSLYTREPCYLGRLFAADSCFYSINRLWVDKAKKRLFMRKNGMTDDFCERIFIHFLYIFLFYAENPA